MQAINSVDKDEIIMRPQSRLPHTICHLLLFPLLLSNIHAAAAQTPHPTFDVATVKPAAPNADPNSGYWSYPGKGRFTATHLSLARLIGLAYDIDVSQIANQIGRAH